MYSPKQDSICDEWHPVIFDIVHPYKITNRTVQYAYFRACIKVLQATVPPPSIEHPRPALNKPVSTNSATPDLGRPHQTTSVTPDALPAPGGHQSPFMVDLTGPDEEVFVKPEVISAPTRLNPIQAPTTRVEDKIQAFREKLNKKEVEELQQMLEKQLPSWIKKLAEDVLEKKMLEELELAESFLV
jgi:hypothetical protein